MVAAPAAGGLDGPPAGDDRASGQELFDDLAVDTARPAGSLLLAAKAGATFISPFVGRLDDVGQEGMQLISDIVEIYRNYPATLRTEVLVASARGVNHVIEAARLGAHVVTIPPKVLRDLALHPLTDKGLAAFLKDWEATGQRIL